MPALNLETKNTKIGQNGLFMVTARQTSSICPKSDPFIWKCVAHYYNVLHIRSFVNSRKKDYWLPIPVVGMPMAVLFSTCIEKESTQHNHDAILLLDDLNRVPDWWNENSKCL